jgi:hypothetical protein
MNKKLSKTFIKHCSACFLTLKIDFKIFENYIYLEIFYIKLDIIILRKFKYF